MACGHALGAGLAKKVRGSLEPGEDWVGCGTVMADGKQGRRISPTRPDGSIGQHKIEWRLYLQRENNERFSAMQRACNSADVSNLANTGDAVCDGIIRAHKCQSTFPRSLSGRERRGECYLAAFLTDQGPATFPHEMKKSIKNH
jgi:hypothetical protein